MDIKKYFALEKKVLPGEESKSAVNATATLGYRTMARAAFWISFLTILSKICGFGREMAFAAVFGVGAEMDAYLVASLIPTVFFANFFGTLKTTAIPVYTRYLGKDRKEAGRMARALLSLAGLLSLACAVAGLLLTPYLVKLLAPGFSGELYFFTVQLSRIMLAAVPFFALTSVATPLLHAHNSFLIPAAIGFPYNAALIGAVLLFGSRYGAVAAAYGLIVAVAGQFFLQYPALCRGQILRPRGVLYHPGVKEIAVLTVPMFIGLISSELNLVVDRIMASGLAEGSISALNYAARLKSLPEGLFVASLLTVLYPQLSRLAADGRSEQFKENINRTASGIVFLLLPMAVGLIVLRRPIVEVLFQRGAFDVLATALTAEALFYYSFGLAFSALNSLLVRAFYSLGDTRTPLKVSLVVLGLNIALNFMLIGSIAHAGLALATSLASGFGLCLLFMLLRRKIGPLGAKRFLLQAFKSCTAALLMGAFLWFASRHFAGFWAAASFLKRTAALLALIAAGALIYGGLTSLFGSKEMRFIYAIVRKKNEHFQ